MTTYKGEDMIGDDSGWSALEILYWLNEKQAIPRRYDNAKRY